MKNLRWNKKLLVISGWLAAVSAMAAGGIAGQPPQTVKYTNLKVLPKNISSRQLQELMVDDFQDGLGVTCSFCHASNKDGHGLDYASDAKPEKQISRMMMRMTLSINSKYFKIKHARFGGDALTVTCNTCHKGEAFPDGSEPK